MSLVTDLLKKSANVLKRIIMAKDFQTLKNTCICRAGRHGFVILNAVFRVVEGFKYVLDLAMATGIQTITIGARDRQ